MVTRANGSRRLANTRPGIVDSHHSEDVLRVGLKLLDDGRRLGLGGFDNHLRQAR
jgi:hypothetical protein